MKTVTNILNYTIHWISRSDSEFIGELFFVIKNNSGGSISTPVGYSVGFIDQGADYYGSHWKILIMVRDVIRYNVQTNSTHIFVKSIYANKLNYYIDKLNEFNRDIIRIDPKLPTAIRETLIQSRICSSPLEIQMITGKDKLIFSNVKYDFD